MVSRWGDGSRVLHLVDVTNSPSGAGDFSVQTDRPPSGLEGVASAGFPTSRATTRFHVTQKIGQHRRKSATRWPRGLHRHGGTEHSPVYVVSSVPIVDAMNIRQAANIRYRFVVIRSRCVVHRAWERGMAGDGQGAGTGGRWWWSIDRWPGPVAMGRAVGAPGRDGGGRSVAPWRAGGGSPGPIHRGGGTGGHVGRERGRIRWAGPGALGWPGACRGGTWAGAVACSGWRHRRVVGGSAMAPPAVRMAPGRRWHPPVGRLGRLGHGWGARWGSTSQCPSGVSGGWGAWGAFYGLEQSPTRWGNHPRERYLNCFYRRCPKRPNRPRSIAAQPKNLGQTCPNRAPSAPTVPQPRVISADATERPAAAVQPTRALHP